MLELAESYGNGETLQIQQIAAAQNIPDRYLEQLLATLRRAGLIVSERGKKGGYLLARAPWKITLLDSVNCMDGEESKDKAADQDGDPQAATLTAILGIWQEARLPQPTDHDVLHLNLSRRGASNSVSN
jgi:Rrf2 family protein